MNSNKVILGILGGFAAGALAGILFAPEKGSKTRQNIKQKGEDFVDDVKDKFDEFLEKISDKFESMQEMTENTMSNGKHKFNELKKEVN